MSGLGKLGQALPNTMGGMMQMNKGTMSPGALDTKTKSLIEVGIAVTVRCDGCMTMHIKDALNAGATKAEITEAIGVGILMGGGPAVIAALTAQEILEQLAA
ncbi:MAG: carboxymuconolactone decarboxylase family protein [Chloroflexaceae bacterium]|nr:carboxymuconolactone decarboxylase family protein [Chloroflexaceae bacterium]